MAFQPFATAAAHAQVADAHVQKLLPGLKTHVLAQFRTGELKKALEDRCAPGPRPTVGSTGAAEIKGRFLLSCRPGICTAAFPAFRSIKFSPANGWSVHQLHAKWCRVTVETSVHLWGGSR